MKLSINGIGKRYKGGVWGLRNFSMDLEPGVLALVGPNGAGKSTLMRILATITAATEGTVLWKDMDIARYPDELRKVLGYLPQDFSIYPHLNAEEFLEYIAALKGMDRNTSKLRTRELLQVVNLFDVRKQALGTFSGGMKQRLGIAQALLNDPELLIVDEPTAGLDPETRVSFRNLLSELAGDRIVILSTHIISDAEAAASEIALISNGSLIRHTSPEQLLQAVEGKVWEWIIPSSELKSTKEQYLISSTARRSDGVHIRIVNEKAPGPDTHPVSPTLEDAYLHFRSSSTRSRDEKNVQ